MASPICRDDNFATSAACKQLTVLPVMSVTKEKRKEIKKRELLLYGT